MASLMDGIWAMADAMSQKKDNNVSRSQASVTRVDNEGIVWVHIPGGTDETPINGRSVADAKSGDTVLVEISGGRCSIVGNATSPAVGERKVVETVAPVAIKVERAKAQASEAHDLAESVEGIAQEAKAVAEATGQHFWPDTDGVHVTEVTQDDWNDSTGTNYHSGANVLLNALGQLFRDGPNNILAIVSGTDPGIAIYGGDGNDADNIVASFNKNGYQIGRTAGLHQIGTASAIEFYDESGQSVAYVSTEKFFSENVDVGGTITIDSYAIREDTDGKLVIGLR